eukprot:CAMPEP_0204614238 /NCGR_PEP_ID=MMETSP0717-20131115/1998_1 /ASSEMBLY_ACC=CAM_ASM_000666 /TAXON_ID=230516 /ORGANISM="Chaetoceros curvisetus" /LENGTH=168 /DNA_ID=CAMNT_0051626853 /DNA_START=575 /DNA_END=1081 /DNA_ORIENTATION=+
MVMQECNPIKFDSDRINQTLLTKTSLKNQSIYYDNIIFSLYQSRESQNELITQLIRTLFGVRKIVCNKIEHDYVVYATAIFIRLDTCGDSQMLPIHTRATRSPPNGVDVKMKVEGDTMNGEDVDNDEGSGSGDNSNHSNGSEDDDTDADDSSERVRDKDGIGSNNVPT